MKPKALSNFERVALFVCLIVALGCGSEDPRTAPAPGVIAGAGGEGGDDGGGGEGATAGDDSGASGAGGDGGSPAAFPSGPLLPWRTGNTWQYRVTQDGIVTLKTTTVGERGPVGGVGPHAEDTAYHVVTNKGTDMKDRTESWQAPAKGNPERVLRFREQAFGAQTGDLELEEYWDPPRIHIDGSPAKMFSGSAWSETYEETKLEVGRTPITHAVTDVWTVISDDETLKVPAGEFEHAIHLRKTSNSNVKEYWYLRGVGKLKEIGGQTEELIGYTIVGEDAP